MLGCGDSIYVRGMIAEWGEEILTRSSLWEICGDIVFQCYLSECDLSL